MADKDTLLPQRKDLRLNGFDYDLTGAYFVTVCVKDRKPILSKVSENDFASVGETIGLPSETLVKKCFDSVSLTEYGEIVNNAIKMISQIYPSISVDCYVIMPDHVHLILRIMTDENGRPMVSPTVSRVICQMKGYVTKQIGFSVWQKSFYDHVIRNKQDYDECSRYIHENPMKRMYSDGSAQR